MEAWSPEMHSRMYANLTRGAICLIRNAFAVAILMGFAGCGSSSPYAPVSGVITLDGKPVAEASVAFHPNAGGRPAYALTGEDGAYALTSVQRGDGALIGSHSVTVTAVEIIESEKAKAMREQYKAEELGSLVEAMPIPPPKEVWLVPQRYSDKKSSGLEFTVESGENTANFDLKGAP